MQLEKPKIVLVIFFILGFLTIFANFSFAQVDCSQFTPDDLKKPNACGIYTTESECNNNICLIDNVFCSWKDNACVGSEKLKPLEIQYPTVPGYGTIKPDTMPAEYIRYVFVFALWILGIVALSKLIHAGILWFFSGASSDAKANAMKITQNIVIGVFLFLATYLILNTINPDLLKLNKKLPENIPKVVINKPEECEHFKIKTCDDYNFIYRTAYFGIGTMMKRARSFCESDVCQTLQGCKWDMEEWKKLLNMTFINIPEAIGLVGKLCRQGGG